MRDSGIVELEAVVRVRVVALRPLSQPWWLVTILKSKVEDIAAIYNRRITIEQQFRDTRGCHYGLEIIWNQFDQEQHIGRLFVCAGIALAVFAAIGHDERAHGLTATSNKGAAAGDNWPYCNEGCHEVRDPFRPMALECTSKRPNLSLIDSGLRLVLTRFTV